MRKALKFLHTLASCGMIGAMSAYIVILLTAPQDTAGTYADMRETISALCTYLLLPSLAVVLVTGLLSMAAHRPFQERRWAWAKLLLGIGTFEATLGIIQSKANSAAVISRKVASGEAADELLATALAYEWYSIGAILILTVANIVLGVWRPSLKKRQQAA